MLGRRHPEPLFRYAIVSDTHIRPPGESSSPWNTNLLTNDRAMWVAEQVNAPGSGAETPSTYTFIPRRTAGQRPSGRLMPNPGNYQRCLS